MTKKRITRTEYVLTLSDEKEYVVKPLSLSKVKELASMIKEIEKLPDEADIEQFPELVNKLTDVCFIILNENNKGITKEKTEKIVSIEDIKDIFTIGMTGTLPEGTESEEI